MGLLMPEKWRFVPLIRPYFVLTITSSFMQITRQSSMANKRQAPAVKFVNVILERRKFWKRAVCTREQFSPVKQSELSTAKPKKNRTQLITQMDLPVVTCQRLSPLIIHQPIFPAFITSSKYSNDFLQVS